jgi:arylsulfatase A-like enzyme
MSLGRRAAAVVLVLLAGCGRNEDTPRLNVILVTLDTTRADHLGAYGHPGDITPNLDALAQDGTRFDLAISAAAVTPVSHASILTGLYPFTHGLRVLSAEGGYRLPSTVPTLATVLKERGYRTAAIHSAFPVSAYFGFERGFDLFESFDSSMKVGPKGATWDLPKLQRRSDQTTDLALDFLGRSKEPFFLWLHYWDPHDAARVPPPEFLPADVPRNELGQPLPGRALYAAEMHYMDHEFGRLVQALKQSSEYERTIIVIVADHGEGLGDHGWEYHRILYQEQIHVPLIVRVPGVKQAASSAALVRSIDILPTVLDYLGVAGPKAVDGESLRNLLEGRPDHERTAYADQLNALDANAGGLVKSRPLDDFLFCAMDARWKLVYRPAHPRASELYNIRDDPHETQNQFTRHPEEAVRLERELGMFGGWVTKPFPPLGDAQARAQAQQALNSLGYAGSAAAHDLDWSWSCPEHTDVVQEGPGKCSVCGGPLIPSRAKQ